MKGKETTPEKVFVIDIKLNRGLVVALSCVLVLAALITVLTLTGDSASASETEAAQAASAGMRQYYLTQSSGYDGSQVLDACAEGYHTASLWEITEPSTLKYNTVLGATTNDSGEGPMTHPGWVRTGYANSVSNIPGHANCAVWTSSDSANWGTMVNLPADWSAGGGDVSVWEAYTFPCSGQTYVWCIED